MLDELLEEDELLDDDDVLLDVEDEAVDELVEEVEAYTLLDDELLLELDCEDDDGWLLLDVDDTWLLDVEDCCTLEEAGG